MIIINENVFCFLCMDMGLIIIVGEDKVVFVEFVEVDIIILFR